MMDDETLKIWSYVNISSYRTRAVRSLEGDVKTPTKIAEDVGIRRNHISKVLRELKTSGVTECINEEVKKGRLYRLTDLGDEIVKKLE